MWKARNFKNEIIKCYTEQNLSAGDIARRFGLTTSTVSWNLRRWGYPFHGQYKKWNKHPCWKGGRVKSNQGYWDIRLEPTDFFYSMCRSNGYVREHRLIMAKHLNRCLLAWEVVHHKNGDKSDNKLENLILLPHKRWHLSDTVAHSQIANLEREVNMLRKENQRLTHCLKIRYLLYHRYGQGSCSISSLLAPVVKF